MNKNLTHIKYISASNEDERAELVSRKDFPARLFKGVVCDDSKKVKLALLDNHNPNAEVVSRLCADDDIEVRAKAYDKLCGGGDSS